MMASSSQRYVQYRSSLHSKTLRDNMDGEDLVMAPSKAAESSPQTSLTAEGISVSPSRIHQYRESLAKGVGRLSLTEKNDKNEQKSAPDSISPPRIPPPPPSPASSSVLHSPSSVATTQSLGVRSPDRYKKYRSLLANKVAHDETKELGSSLTNLLTVGQILTDKERLSPTSPPRYRTYRESLANKVPIASVNHGFAESSSIKKENESSLAEQPNSDIPVDPATVAQIQKETSPPNSSFSPPRYQTYRASLAAQVHGPIDASAHAPVVACVAPESDRSNASKQNANETVGAPLVLSVQSKNITSLDAPPEASKALEESDGPSETTVERDEENSNKKGRDQPNQKTSIADTKETEVGMQKDCSTLIEEDEEEDNQLASRLSTFLAKAEKGKLPIPQQELDMHTSWSDFDAADLPPKTPPTSLLYTGSNSKRSDITMVREEQARLIQKAVASALGSIPKSTDGKSTSALELGSIQTEQSKTPVKRLAPNQEEALQPNDIESGLRLSQEKRTERDEPSYGNCIPKMCRGWKGLFCFLICLMVLAIGGFLFANA